MKLLRFKAEGLPLFKKKLDISFYAQQRVSEDHKEVLNPLFSNVYLNPANGFIGVNASGKTSILRVILLVLGIMNNEPINHMETKDVLGDAKHVIFDIYFYSEVDKAVCHLEIVITSRRMNTEGIIYSIASEKIRSKPVGGITTRKRLFDFGGGESVSLRSGEEDFLPDDVSIMIARNKKTGESVRVTNLLHYTNINILPFSEKIPTEVITYLDPTIESLQFKKRDQKVVIDLKFKGKEKIVLNHPIELNHYLSSGTVKGIITFTLAQEVLQSGGYLIVDEIDNHFNKEIVATLLRLFMDQKINKRGGALIFSTHYPELLDEFDRNDSIYIVRNRDGIEVENLSSLLKRNDIKKSDAYQSGFLEGTTPMYEAYMRLKKSIAKTLT